jgi:NAD+ diphosphatase
MPHRPDLGPKPHLGYTASLLDRAAHRRNEAAELLADPRAGAYLVGGELIITRKRGQGGDPLFGLAEARALAPGRETVLLGFLDGAPRFGLAIGKEDAEALKARDDFLVTDLRTIAVQGLVAPEHLPPIAEAKALLAWHARHRFCANCGAATDLVEGGWKRACPACGVEHFPRTDPVVIMLAVKGEHCLLGRSARFASSMWSCLAGFVEPGENIEEAARRLFRLAAVAVPDVADDRLPCRGADDRHRGGPRRARRRALVRARGGGADAQAPPPRRPRHAAAGRDRASHHSRLGRGGRV